jgi:hypothetical protein
MGVRLVVPVSLAAIFLVGGCTGVGHASSAQSRSVSETPTSQSASESSATSSAAICDSAPQVEVTAPGKTAAELAYGRKITVTARVGQPVTVRFIGDCAVGGRLMINGAGAGGANSYTDVWMGQVDGSWTPTRAGTRTLLAAWACMGPETCPLGFLGYIKVVTPVA